MLRRVTVRWAIATAIAVAALVLPAGALAAAWIHTLAAHARAGSELQLQGRAFTLPLFLVPVSTFVTLPLVSGGGPAVMPHEPSGPSFISLGRFPDNPNRSGPDPLSIRFKARIPDDVPPGKYLVTIYCATCGPRGTLIPDAWPGVNPQLHPVRILAADDQDGSSLVPIAGGVVAALAAAAVIVGARLRRRQSTK